MLQVMRIAGSHIGSTFQKIRQSILKVSLWQRANKVSRRYGDDTPEFSAIPAWRVC